MHIVYTYIHKLRGTNICALNFFEWKDVVKNVFVMYNAYVGTHIICYFKLLIKIQNIPKFVICTHVCEWTDKVDYTSKRKFEYSVCPLLISMYDWHLLCMVLITVPGSSWLIFLHFCFGILLRLFVEHGEGLRAAMRFPSNPMHDW